MPVSLPTADDENVLGYLKKIHSIPAEVSIVTTENEFGVTRTATVTWQTHSAAARVLDNGRF